MAERRDEHPTILVVDDEVANLQVLLTFLEEEGFRILVANSGERALNQLQYCRPDAILLDVMMPGLDGFATCRRIKADPRFKDIPVLFMTALTDTEDKVEGFAAGGVDYITKPFQREEVLARLRTHLRLARQQRELARERERFAQMVAWQEETNRELEREKEMLKVTLRSIGDGVIATDVTGRVILLNRIAERLTGWSEAEAVGRPLQEVFHIINERTREVCENPVTKVLQSGRIVGLANHTVLIAKDGTERSIADSAAPIRGREGQIFGTVLVFRDVTLENRLAEELAVMRPLKAGLLATSGKQRARVSQSSLIRVKERMPIGIPSLICNISQ